MNKKYTVIAIIIAVLISLSGLTYAVTVNNSIDRPIRVNDGIDDEDVKHTDQEDLLDRQEISAADDNEVIFEDEMDFKYDSSGVDIFLKLDGIQGESNDDKHKNEIDIAKFLFGGRASKLGETNENSRLNVIKVLKNVDKSSPKLFQAMLNGDKINNAILYQRKAGGKPLEFLKLVMNDVVVTSYEQYGKIEEVCFGYSKITYSYIPQKNDGSAGTPITATWDLKTNDGR